MLDAESREMIEQNPEMSTGGGNSPFAIRDWDRERDRDRNRTRTLTRTRVGISSPKLRVSSLEPWVGGGAQ